MRTRGLGSGIRGAAREVRKGSTAGALVAVLALVATGWAAPAGAQAGAQAGERTREWHAGPMVAYLADPTIGNPPRSGGIQLAGESIVALGVRGGVTSMGERSGWGLDVHVLRASLDDFALPYGADDPSQVGSGDYAYYDGPSLTQLGAAASFVWVPAVGRPFQLTGVLGVSLQMERVTIANGQLVEWDGSRSRSEVMYQFGAGGRWLLHPRAVVIADVRLVAADAGFACRLGDDVGPGAPGCADRRDNATSMPRLMSLTLAYRF